MVLWGKESQFGTVRGNIDRDRIQLLGGTECVWTVKNFRRNALIFKAERKETTPYFVEIYGYPI
jgi:hypothetical protein